MSLYRSSCRTDAINESEAMDDIFRIYEIPSGVKAEKLSLMMVASLIETLVESRTAVLSLQGKLMERVEWLPLTLGKLVDVSEIDLSENQIMALPTTIGSLKMLSRFDIHSNQLINLPVSFGELSNLIHLDLRGNRMKSLPSSFGTLTNLVNLDISSNEISKLPETFRNLLNLQRLNAETNELEELPYEIGSCCSLVELRLDFNKIKTLPEAVGKLERMEVLTLRYNRIKGLPTTIGSLTKLKELDVSFNELECIPESLGFATSLVKLNLGGNFTDLRWLPGSIGNLEMLEKLDISNNQISVLPDSFGLLSKLRGLDAYQTPLRVPPQKVVKLGADAVVQYMGDLTSSKDTSEKLGCWFWICLLFQSFRRDNNTGCIVGCAVRKITFRSRFSVPGFYGEAKRDLFLYLYPVVIRLRTYDTRQYPLAAGALFIGLSKKGFMIFNLW